METVRAVLLVVIAFSLIVGTHGYCSLQFELQKCMDILQPGINFKEIAGNHPTWNRTQLEHACSHLDEFFMCYDNVVNKCQEESLRKVRIVFTKTFSYICGEGRELYLKTRVCLNEEPTKGQVKDCMVFARDAHRIHTKDEACSKIKELSKCVERAAGHCGEDGKTFINRFLKKMVTGLIDCGGLSHGVISAIIAVVCITIALIAVVISALIRRRNKVPFERMQS